MQWMKISQTLILCNLEKSESVANFLLSMLVEIESSLKVITGLIQIDRTLTKKPYSRHHKLRIIGKLIHKKLNALESWLMIKGFPLSQVIPRMAEETEKGSTPRLAQIYKIILYLRANFYLKMLILMIMHQLTTIAFNAIFAVIQIQ